MPKHILVIDDEPSIVDNVVYALEREGMTTQAANTGDQGLRLIQGHDPDLIILDIGLPDLSGIEVFRKLRELTDTPVIFLTARGDEIDRVLGLELGADDYVTKPFSPRELAARVKTVLRRSERPMQTSSLFVIDESRKEIRFRDTPLALTRFEFGILARLLSRPGQVFSRDSLLDQVWSDDTSPSDRVIDTHIKSIRAKLNDIEPGNKAIRTHRGFGYSTVIQ